MITKKSKIKNTKLKTRKRYKKNTSSSFVNTTAPASPLAVRKNSKTVTTRFKEKFKFGTAYVGDAAVKIGKRIQNSGYLTVGRAVEKMGSTIESLEH